MFESVIAFTLVNCSKMICINMNFKSDLEPSNLVDECCHLFDVRRNVREEKHSCLMISYTII